MRRWSLPLTALPLLLLAVSCHRPGLPATGEPSHIRIEPSRAPDDPLRHKPVPGVATAQEVGILFYPGAKVQTSSLVRDARGITAVVKLSTRDAYVDVAHFYQAKYAGLAQMTNLDSKEGRSLALNWRAPGATFTVDIKQDLAGKQTLIHLVRLTGARSAPTPKKR